MTSSIKCLALALGLTGLCQASAAAADDAQQQAGVYFDAGVTAYREGRYQEAIDAFSAAYRLDPDPALVFNAGQAWEKLGNVTSALRTYREYLRLAVDAPDRAKVETRVRSLEARLRERGVQQISISSTPAGAALSVDGTTVGLTPWTGELTPGQHHLVLTLPGHSEAQREIEVPADRSADVEIALLASAAPIAETFPASAEATPAVLVEAAPAADRPHPVRWWTYGALGTSAALALGSGGFELARRTAESDARAEPTQIGYHELYQQAQFHQLAARVLLGASAVVAAVGGALLIFDLTSGHDEPAAAAGGESS